MPVPLLARHGRLAAALAGAGLPLAFAPFGFYGVAPFALAVLFLALAGQPPRERFRRGFLFGFGAFLAGTWWLYISIHDFGGTSPPFAIAVMLALILLMAFYHGVYGWVTARLAPGSEAVEYLVGLPAAWVLLEWVRGWLLGGFPWLSLGYGQIDGPLAALAPVTGMLGLSLAAALAAGALAALVAGGARGRVAAVLVLVAVGAGTYAVAGRRWTAPAGDELRVALVQGGISQDQKWLTESRDKTLAMYLEITVGLKQSDLIVWPEAAIPVLAEEVPDYLDGLRELAKARRQEILLGILSFDQQNGGIYNSLISLGGDDGAYRKRHLVPFGEFFPVPGFVRSVLKLMSLPYSDISAGRREQPPLRALGIQIAPSICYEDVFGTETRDFLPAAGLLVNVSNDGWFGDSIAPHQHLQMARMRALESGRYMLRTTNTGITAIIGPDGRVLDRAPQFRTEVLTGRVRPYGGTTPWIRWGNGPVLAGAFGLLALAGLLGRRRGVSLPATAQPVRTDP